MARKTANERTSTTAPFATTVERRQNWIAKEAPRRLSERIKGQFAPMYLTLASIIQGAVLTTLVARVEATYRGFDTVDWILTATTFLALVAVWHEYLMQVMAYVWLPTHVDSFVPFGFLVAELFMAHFVYHNLRAWLLAYGAFYLMGVVGWHYQNMQIRSQGDEESRLVDRMLAAYDRLRGAQLMSFALLSLAAAGLYDVLRLGHVQVAVALGACAAIAIFKLRAVPAWNRLIAFANQSTD